jgi:hypothetical protein
MAAALAISLIAAPAARADVSATIGTTPTGSPLPAGFTGVSLEYKAVHLYTGRDPRAVNPVLLELLKAIVPGQPPVVRIGGDSADQTWWQVRGVIPPGGINYRLTGDWLRMARALAVGLRGRLIMGINLATNRPALAAAEARAILQGVGRPYISALEIGNEPDLYPIFPWYADRRGGVFWSRPKSYTLNAYMRDFRRWRIALPRFPLAGPSFSSLGWMYGLDHFISTQPRLGIVTFHRYPLRGCLTDTTSPSFASIPNLLSDHSSYDLALSVAPYPPIAHAHGLPFRLDEMNSAACRGKAGVSDTFASALWAVDTLFNIASVGVDGVNFHSLPGAQYEPFTFTHPGGVWQAFVHPMYYGMLMFGRAFPAGAQLMPVSTTGGGLKIWATRAPSGRIHVVVINKDASFGQNVQLTVPGASGAAQQELLTAPGLGATDGVTLGGRTFGDVTTTGVLPAADPHPVTPQFASSTYTVAVPASSALMVTVG